jgi:hypothetical protein
VIAHPFKEGERVHFAHQHELAAGLRHGYLEMMLIDDGGFAHRVIRYQAESDTYHWSEGPMGYQAQVTKQHTYSSLDEVQEVHDVHAYLWFPLYPRDHYVYQQAAGSFQPFRYPERNLKDIINQTLKRAEHLQQDWDLGA